MLQPNIIEIIECLSLVQGQRGDCSKGRLSEGTSFSIIIGSLEDVKVGELLIVISRIYLLVITLKNFNLGVVHFSKSTT